MSRAAVIGTGLIGASIGIGLRRGGWSVAGWDPQPEALATAGAIGGFDDAASCRDEAVEGADLVVLAGPVGAILADLGEIATDALVTDVAGVKVPVVEAGSRLAHFVGGHPMAGRETSGPDGASGSLFLGATWVLVSTGARDEDVERMSEIVAALGAAPLVLDAAAHDAAVARASHLPHLVATGLVDAVAGDPVASRLAAGGFRDLTRVAMSDPSWWVDVLTANRDAVSVALRALADDLSGLADLVEIGDGARIGARLAASRAVRLAMAAPVATIGVLLEDRPGEIAHVGRALAESDVDLRDLQLRHATHGGGGVLTLSVRIQDTDRLRDALIAEGFRLLGT